jgi:Berberine and berberine like
VVLADGSVVECDADRDADLFWALRGAGSSAPGVVTWLRFATVRQSAMTAFRLTWPADAAAAVVAAWQDWAPDAPDEVAAGLLISATGDREPVVNVFGTTSGQAVDLGIEPASSVRVEGSYRDAKREFAGFDVHGLGGPVEGYTFSTSQFHDQSLPPATIEAWIDQLYLDPAPGVTRMLDLMPMGGAYNRVPAEATAFVHRSDRFLLKAGTVVSANGRIQAAQQWVRSFRDLARLDGTGRAYQNFPDPSLDDAAYFGDNLRRLRRVQRGYDPDGVLTPARPGTAG